jgi:predicted RecA/RadA family phage recombinase
MADITTFVPIRNVLWSGKNIITMTATTAVKAGMLVAINATGVSGAVDPCVATGTPIGVAINDIAAGSTGPIATAGCVVYMNNFSTSAAIDAGDFLIGDDAEGTGMVGAVTTATTPQAIIGVAIDDIAVSSSGRVLLTPGSYTYHA